MRRILFAATALLVAYLPAYARYDLPDPMPDALLGDWTSRSEGAETLVRSPPNHADFHIDKDSYGAEDHECTVLKVEKLAANLYTVQASCTVVDQPDAVETNEFELRGDKLLITPVGS